MTTIAEKLLLLSNTKSNVKQAIEDKQVSVGSLPFADYPARIALIEGCNLPLPSPKPWVRDPSLPEIEANPGDNKVVGLYAVWPGVDATDPGGNFFAMQNAGNYTIDYGDGTTTNYNSNVIAYYEYDFNNPALDGSDAPVTFIAATNTVTRTAHGYENGAIVRFYRISDTTGISEAQQYYVINKTVDSFQVSLTENGPAVDLLVNGSASLLQYKVAIVTITPQVGSTLTSLNFKVFHNKISLTLGYSTGWLDIAIAGADIASLTIAAGFFTNVVHYNLQRVRLNQLGNITDFSYLFYNLSSLQHVEIADTIATVTDMTGMFRECYALATVPLFDTSNVTNMSSMFENCYSLTTVPLFNTSNVTNMDSMFIACYSLTTVPLFDTSNVTNMYLMFYGCQSLLAVPLFNTANVTDISFMVSACYSLTTVPLFDTSNVTNMVGMFEQCYSLTAVPLFNTANVTDMTFMFHQCYSLTTVPLFDTSNVTDMTYMFRECYALATVPLFDTGNVTTMDSMFDNCFSLTTVPFFNTSNVTNMNRMFGGCYSLTTVPLFDTSTVTNMTFMFSNCISLTTVPLFDTSNVTNMTGMFSFCQSLTSVPSLVVTAVTSSVNFSSMFAICNSNTRIQAKDFRFTFSVGNNKLSARALNEIYTNLPTATGQTITVSGNYGITNDDPTIATAKGWTVIGS